MITWKIQNIKTIPKEFELYKDDVLVCRDYMIGIINHLIRNGFHFSDDSIEIEHYDGLKVREFSYTDFSSECNYGCGRLLMMVYLKGYYLN